jgi:hypothetical protein
MDRGTKRDDMEKNLWGEGIWYSGKGEQIPVEEMDNKRLLLTSLFLAKHAISTIHYNYFLSRSLHKDLAVFDDIYKNRFIERTLQFVKVHPIWPFLEKELTERKLYDTFVKRVEYLE